MAIMRDHRDAADTSVPHVVAPRASVARDVQRWCSRQMRMVATKFCHDGRRLCGASPRASASALQRHRYRKYSPHRSHAVRPTASPFAGCAQRPRSKFWDERLGLDGIGATAPEAKRFRCSALFLLRCGKICGVVSVGAYFVPMTARILTRSTTAVAVADVRALVSLIIVSLLGLSLLSGGAELLRGP